MPDATIIALGCALNNAARHAEPEVVEASLKSASATIDAASAEDVRVMFSAFLGVVSALSTVGNASAVAWRDRLISAVWGEPEEMRSAVSDFVRDCL